MIRIITLAIIYLSIISCSSFQDAGKVLRNEKIKSTDEFLVKKKDPLELPPDFDKLPKPGESTNNEKISNEKLDRSRLKFWEVLGTLKWGIMCLNMIEIYRSGFDKSIDRASIGRRSSETEIDLIRKIIIS